MGGKAKGNPCNLCITATSKDKRSRLFSIPFPKRVVLRAGVVPQLLALPIRKLGRKFFLPAIRLGPGGRCDAGLLCIANMSASGIMQDLLNYARQPWLSRLSCTSAKNITLPSCRNALSLCHADETIRSPLQKLIMLGSHLWPPQDSLTTITSFQMLTHRTHLHLIPSPTSQISCRNRGPICNKKTVWV